MSSTTIEISKVFPSEHNPRRIRDNDPRIAELAESFKAHGQLQAGLVRPHPTGAKHALVQGAYEIIAGHRRYAAAVKAGLGVFKAEVVEVDDRVALEMIVTENLQREDLSAIEEARAIRSLCKDGKTIAEVAGVLGKTANWIARRIKLLDLHPDIVKAAENPDSPAGLWTVAMLEDAASLPAETQARLVGDRWDFPASPTALARWISNEQRKLTKAPWDTEDETLLPEIGSCAACMKRASAQPELFADAADGGDRCLDVACWKKKIVAFQTRRIAEVRNNTPGVVLVRGSYDGNSDETEITGVLDPWQYAKVKKAAPGAVQAYIAQGKGAGQTIWIKPEKQSIAAKKKVQAASAVADPKAQLKMKEDALAKRRAALVVRTFVERLQKIKWAGLAVVKGDKDNVLFALAAHVGTVNKSWNLKQAFGKVDGGVEKPDALREALWEQVRTVITQNLQVRDGAHAQACWRVIELLDGILDLRAEINNAQGCADAEIPETKAILKLRREIAGAKRPASRTKTAKPAAAKKAPKKLAGKK